jgi:tetratricopeptide (TPR) repeat protein
LLEPLRFALESTDDAYMTELTPTLWREALNRQGITLVITQAIKDDTAEILALVRELRDVKQTTVHEDTLIAIARKIRPRVTDRAEALRELERAADLAAEQSERSHAGGNVDAFVDGVLRRLADLTEAGRLDAAATAADDAVDRAEAGLTRLLDAAIDQHLLAYDSEGAARQITRRLTLETADPGVLFEALRREFRTWYERGRDRGLRLDLEVAIAIARTSHGRARDADECGTALNDLGNALLTLGGRETGTARLKEAVAAYRDALKERTRDRAPLQWAMTRMNLGNALRTLGERETGTDRLVEAVAAYRDALKEITLDRLPPDWATTQHNLGNALTTLSVRESSVPHLKEAIAAYREALKVRNRDLLPLQWAITQMYLAVVLAGDDLLTDGDFSQALAAIDGAREVFREAGVTAHSKKCEVIRRSITGENPA